MEVFFLKGPEGPLFSAYHPAIRRRPIPLGLVYVPPFAEEMNRARRMAALQARRLAELGVDVLLLDPFGTGDSAGDFGDARWEIWREDVKTAITWMGARTEGKVGLWGLRLGALLAADVAAEDPDRIMRLILWQPVLSGNRYLTQFLRLRVAASMDKHAERESTEDLRARFAQGESVEIAGYEMASALANAVASLKLELLMHRLNALPSHWLEVTSAEKASLTPASEQLISELGQQGRQLAAQAVVGEPFWAIQETTLAPNLLRSTDDILRA